MEDSLSQEPLLTTEEAAETLGMTARYLESLRYKGGGPKYFRLSRRAVRYSRRALNEWLRSRAFTSTTQEAEAEDGTCDPVQS